jgi:hypothetical protein
MRAMLVPLSLPLDGGSLRGQAIPACYKHAPHYFPNNYKHAHSVVTRDDSYKIHQSAGGKKTKEAKGRRGDCILNGHCQESVWGARAGGGSELDRRV